MRLGGVINWNVARRNGFIGIAMAIAIVMAFSKKGSDWFVPTLATRNR